ncbi:basic leucine zipper 19-like [Chenopodium quinoa]|nr:basic leucine zipper 19-like [Chenopodium quinoa]
MENNQYNGNSSSISSNNINNNGTNLHVSNVDVFSSISVGEAAHSGRSMENILEDLLQDTQACPETNTCSLSEDCSHTHDFFHKQSDEMFPSNEEKSSYDDSLQIEEQQSKKRGRRQRADNKEAVRKYREKLRIREASLEEEIKMLKESNQQLLKKLEGEAALQEEILWLKCLLVDIRGRIEGETNSIRFRRQPDVSLIGNDRMVHCNGNSGNGGKTKKSNSMLYGEGTNGGISINFNYTPSIGSEPKDTLNFGHQS